MDKISVIWEGSFFLHHSLSRMNEEIALALDKNKISLHLLPYETPHFSEKMDRRLLKLSPFFEPNQETVNFHIRHQWPPNFKKPPQGDLILMQPWEFGSLPIEWVDHSSDVREFWAYSSFVKKIYSLSGIPEEKIFIIPGGIGEQFVPGGEKIDLPTKKSFRFLYVGGLIPRKGFDLLLRAYLEEFKPEEDVCLVVRDFYYASQWKEEIKNLSQRKDIPEILHYTTYLLPFQIPNLYRACHVYVHPYRGEGFGLPILEAQACGLPVIIYKKGKIPKEVRKYCFEAESPEHMAQIIESIKENGYNEKLRKKATKYARGFTWDKCAKSTFETYRVANE